jgi:dienelactone hydrolase
VAVLPKPIRPCPVIIYAHGSGGSLMNDGFELRQMAEMGLAVVSIEYNQSNEVAFASELESVSGYIARQKWADTNAIAWVGFSLGANRLLDFALQHPNQRPQLLVLLSGDGLQPSAILDPPSLKLRRTGPPSSSPMCPVLLLHGEQDEVFPVADTERFAAMLLSNGVPMDLKILPGLSHGMEPDRGVVFRGIGEYCRAHLSPASRTQRWWDEHRTPAPFGPQYLFFPDSPHPAFGHLLPLPWAKDLGEGETFPASRQGAAPGWFVGSVGESFGESSPEWWQKYHSIARWQAEAPGLVWFWIPAAAWAIGGYIRFRRRRAKAVAQTFLSAGAGDFPVASFPGDGCAEGGGPAPTGGSRPTKRLAWYETALRWLAAVLAVWAAVETGLHLIPPHFQVSDRTLAIAQRMLVQDKERADFEALAGRPIWREQKLQTLLDHVELAVYNRQLINWQLDGAIYRDYVLWPVITGEAGERLDWRRPLWEEFYPRIRHESSAEEAARIVVRHLRERVTVVAGPNLPRTVPDIWLRQLTDQTGFEIIYVAALRSVGVPARLDAKGVAEFFSGDKWQTAPDPVVLEAWK